MADGILNSFHRITKIYKADNGNLKVDVIDQMEYRYLSHEHRGIGKNSKQLNIKQRHIHYINF